MIDQFSSLESVLEKAFRSIFPVKQVDKENVKTKSPDNFKLKLLLSATQMVTENYPLPLSGTLADKYKHYKMTKDSYDEVTLNSPLY